MSKLVHHVALATGDDIMLAPGLSAYMVGEGPLSKAPAAPGAKPATPVSRADAEGRDGFLRWGDNNDFPQQIVDLYSQDPIIPRTLNNQLAQLLGGGLLPVQQTVGEDGKEKNAPITDPAITGFLGSISTLEYLQQAGADLLWFWNALPDLIVSRDRSMIVQIVAQQMAYGRYAKPGSSGKPEHLYLSANWPRTTADDKLTLKIALHDLARLDAVDSLRASTVGEVITPLRGPSPGRQVYALAPHDAIRTSGWLEVHLAIPQFKKFLMKNQMTIKWHIKVEQGYWASVYGAKEWKDMGHEKQLAAKKKWLTDMSASLTNVEKTGMAIMTETKYDVNSKLMNDFIQILPLEGQQLSGEYITDNMEAAANIFYALGTDPTVAGFASKEMGSRSGGSDKREAYLIALQMMKPQRDLLLKPLYFIADYNGWTAKYPGFKLLYKDTLLTTLDTGASTKDVAK